MKTNMASQHYSARIDAEPLVRLVVHSSSDRVQSQGLGQPGVLFESVEGMVVEAQMRSVLSTDALNGSAQLTEDTPYLVISAICVRDSGRFVLSHLAPHSFFTGRILLSAQNLGASASGVLDRRHLSHQVNSSHDFFRVFLA